MRARRIALIAAILMIMPAAVSFLSTIAQPSNSGFFIRSVEWLRANGARGLVDSVENAYYSMNAPAKGGPALRALPKQAGASHGPTRPHAAPGGTSRPGPGSSGAAPPRPAPSQPAHPKTRIAYRPPRIAPIIHPALPGEGIWHSTFAPAAQAPPVTITSYRPEPAYPQLVAAVAWIDQARTSVWLYPGRDEPAVTMPNRGPMEVPTADRHKLVATFNSAFKLADSGGGFAYKGHTYAPLKDGLATILRYRGGKVQIVDWHRGPDAPANIDYARQNLPLIVNDRHPSPKLSDSSAWGATVGNTTLVWRSAIGVDRHGNLIYAAANDQTVSSLAQIMIHAGAVRAMQLDINSYWPSFITYRLPGAQDPANLLPNMVRSPYRYLTPDDRDFFAVYVAQGNRRRTR